MPDTTWGPCEAKLEGGLVVFLQRVGKRIVYNHEIKEKTFLGIWGTLEKQRLMVTFFSWMLLKKIGVYHSKLQFSAEIRPLRH